LYSSTININIRGELLEHSLLHELGHLVSFEVLKKEAFDEYRKISWIKLGPIFIRKHSNFISKYASTTPEEDFAETYAAYVLYGDEFRQAIRGNSLPLRGKIKW
jgi:hypothetical protein